MMLLYVLSFCSWAVNVIDGILLIAAHILYHDPSAPAPPLYRFLYKPYYIYTVWIIEVTRELVLLFEPGGGKEERGGGGRRGEESERKERKKIAQEKEG